MNNYSCECSIHNGQGFSTDREGLTPTMVHNYTSMCHNPPMVAVMSAKGFVAR